MKRDVPIFAPEGAGGEGVRRKACFVLRQGGKKNFYVEKQKSYWTSLLKRGNLSVYISAIIYIVRLTARRHVPHTVSTGTALLGVFSLLWSSSARASAQQPPDFPSDAEVLSTDTGVLSSDDSARGMSSDLADQLLSDDEPSASTRAQSNAAPDEIGADISLSDDPTASSDADANSASEISLAENDGIATIASDYAPVTPTAGKTTDSYHASYYGESGTPDYSGGILTWDIGRGSHFFNSTQNLSKWDAETGADGEWIIDNSSTNISGLALVITARFWGLIRGRRCASLMRAQTEERKVVKRISRSACPV